ncbi:PIN domain-containing protein [Amycolatopsis sp. A133]|uniref:PIN domain-containing protein n=1 Tax=Amycolatopsis sp. A133 TaxID=3064472 RepID=UPI0027FFDF14|nr:PIN domain-containing protein [Amycolatopsis sp. A133]MDQ7809396.1 PIN domain-containing protein [Amycolatopsis sp. A133]
MLLRSLRDQVANLEGGGVNGTGFDRLLAYLNWAANAAGALGNQVSEADLARLVLTKRYEQLLSGVGTLAGTDTVTVVNLLVSLELRERVVAFNQAVAALQQIIDRWSSTDLCVVADSSFYIHHPVKLKDIDLTEVVDFDRGYVRLLVPMVVIDELDGLKESKNKHVRWRAAHTLGVLDELFRDGAPSAKLRATRVEILFDPPGHSRLAINDDEIVDRAVSAQALAYQPAIGRKVVLLTYDTGQASRARRADLDVLKLNQPPEEEPAATA